MINMVGAIRDVYKELGEPEGKLTQSGIVLGRAVGAQMEEVVTWILTVHPCAKNVRLC